MGVYNLCFQKCGMNPSSLFLSSRCQESEQVLFQKRHLLISLFLLQFTDQAVKATPCGLLLFFGGQQRHRLSSPSIRNKVGGYEGDYNFRN